MSRYWWLLLAVPVLAPLTWFYWDSDYYIFGGDTPTWVAFDHLIEWHFPYLWDEFDGAGHPFANNVPLPTAFFFWALWKLSVPTLVAQVSFFVILSALSAIGVYRIGRLYFAEGAQFLFVFVAALVYLLNPFGFYGENRRIFTTEFLVAYYLLPLFVSYLLTAMSDAKLVVREALLASLTTVALHNFNLIPAVSYVAITYATIALTFILIQARNAHTVFKFALIFLAMSFLLATYHLYAMLEYYKVSSLVSDLGKIVPSDIRSTADLLIRTLMFIGGGREISSPLLVPAHLLPLLVGIGILFHSPSRSLVVVCGAVLIVSLFFMDAGHLATQLFSVSDASSFFYAIFRYPHIKFTAPYTLSVALLCGIGATHFPNRKFFIIAASILFIVMWNHRAFTQWMPIQLQKPDAWLELSEFMQQERAGGVLPRTVKVPSVEYFRDGVGGEAFNRTPPMRKEGAVPWMVHGAALGLLMPHPIFSLDMSVGARLNPCVARLFRADPDPQELTALFRLLGIERVLLSKHFSYQDQFTPAGTVDRMQQLVSVIQRDIRTGETIFQNESINLFRPVVDPLPLIYTAAEVRKASPEAFAKCAFPIPSSNESHGVAFYSVAPETALPADLDKPISAGVLTAVDRVAPGRYRVRLRGVPASSPVVLVLNNTYADWVIETPGLAGSNNQFRDRRFPVNGFAVAWVLDAASLCKGVPCVANQGGDYDAELTIAYAPQRTYQTLLFGAIACAMAIITFLFISAWRRRPSHGGLA